MSIDYERLKARPFEHIVHEYTERDTMLYALGVCCGADPTDARDLRFVYEEQLQALPTMAAVMCTPGFWLKEPDTGVDWQRVLHGEQSLVIHRPLAPRGRLIGKPVIEEIIDKGPGKGALIYVRRDLRDADSGELVCTVRLTSFARGDGGFGGPAGPVKPVHRLPERAPDERCALPTWPHSALLYRLNGDYNPLHADPAVAEGVGFRQPILHGLCSYGVAGHALVRTVCGNDATRLRQLDVRFSSPVYPGETLSTEIWHEAPGQAGFRCRIVERDVVAIDNGLCLYEAAR